MATEDEKPLALEQTNEHEGESEHNEDVQTRHGQAAPAATDSMVSVPLSEGMSSAHLSRDVDAARNSSMGTDFEEYDHEGSDDVGSDYEEAIVEEASVGTRARGPSIFTLMDSESKAESGEDVSSKSFDREAKEEAEEEIKEEAKEEPVQSHVADNGDVTPIDETSAEKLDLTSTKDALRMASLEDARRDSVARPDITVNTDIVRSRPSSVASFDGMQSNAFSRASSRGSMDLRCRGIDRISTLEMEETLDMIEETEEGDDDGHYEHSRSGSAGSEGSAPVDWDRLDRTEQQEQQDADDTSDEQTALLLARLEQENQAIATDPKGGIKQRTRKATGGRPPSIYDIKSLVQKSHDESTRVSRMPSPPPMTELDFWAALVRDYPSTAQRLPTLTSNKIRGGIPPPLRGVVWVSMAGARDNALEEQYDGLLGEQSPYETIISKDIGRSFPGVEMFRDPEGEGQRMLGRVLKCFSLYNTKIGYCQGLGFLVGPLLMQMGEREAFCVLVRLMEDYDLHSCFQPDLSGLHLRIYQFQELLHRHLPVLATHLDELQVEAAYLSQWFLSFFAVTCPLPMLFRIYDVIFAEGASETIMRVALSVMRRNEKKIIALTEFEDVMQLLLGRALWDTYGLHKGSGDELVNDFVSFTSLVTRENLRELDASFKAAQSGESGARPGFLPDVQHTAGRFLGRLWAPATSATPTPTKAAATLSPGAMSTPGSSLSRPGSFLRRTPSKQSLASTHNSTEGSSDSMASSSSGTTMTDATTVSRVVSDDFATSVKSNKTQTESLVGVMKGNAASTQDRDLHSQIEDLLMALTDMQKGHAQLAQQLAKEREEREEDCLIVRTLLDGLTREKTKGKRASDQELQSRRRTMPPTECPGSAEREAEEQSDQDPPSSRISQLIASAEYRFPLTPGHHRRSVTVETKAQLRDALAQAREHFSTESTRAAELARQLDAKDQEAATTLDQLREARSRIQTEYSERQKLEKTIVELRQSRRAAAASASPTRRQTLLTTESNSPAATDTSTENRNRSNSGTGPKGLREFRLGRAQTAATPPPPFNKRTSSLATHAALGNLATNVPSVPSSSSAVSATSADGSLRSRISDPQDREALLLELVNAKTAEAVARQELEEMKGKFESMRRMLGQQSPSSGTTTPGVAGHKTNPSEGFLSFMGTAGTAARDAIANAVSREGTPTPTGASGSGVSDPTASEKEKEKEKEKVKTPAAAGGSWGWGWGKKSAN